MLITFANSLDPDQARQNVGPDLDPSCLTLWWYSWKNFLKKLILKKVSKWQKKHAKLPSRQSVNLYHVVYGPRWEKTCLQWFANNKDADQPAHRPDWSAPLSFVFWKVSSLSLLQAKFDFLASLCSWGDWLESRLSETAKTGFVASRFIYNVLHYYSIFVQLTCRIPVISKYLHAQKKTVIWIFIVIKGKGGKVAR